MRSPWRSEIWHTEGVQRSRELPDVAHLDLDEAKGVLRSVLRDERKSLTRKALARAGDSIAKHGLPLLDDTNCIAAYINRPTEPPILPLINALYESGTTIWVPALGPGLARMWAPYAGEDDLEVRAPNRPPEPSSDPVPTEEISHVDAVIAPALAVDMLGNRLGQGGGWYDRVLKQIPSNIPVWAVVFDQELVNGQLPVDDMDVPIGGVIRPSGVVHLDQ